MVELTTVIVWFVVVPVDADLEQARQLAQALCRAVAAQALPVLLWLVSLGEGGALPEAPLDPRVEDRHEDIAPDIVLFNNGNLAATHLTYSFGNSALTSSSLACKHQVWNLLCLHELVKPVR